MSAKFKIKMVGPRIILRVEFFLTALFFSLCNSNFKKYIYGSVEAVYDNSYHTNYFSGVAHLPMDVRGRDVAGFDPAMAVFRSIVCPLNGRALVPDLWKPVNGRPQLTCSNIE